MLNEMFVKIPLDKIDRIKIYRNPVRVSSRRRKSLKEIVEETGADYAINGTLYDMRTGKAVCPLKAEGVTDCETAEGYWGYTWKTYQPETFEMHVVPDKSADNYLACVNLINPNDGVVTRPIYGAELGGQRGRTAIGTYPGGIALYVGYDKGSARRTPESLRDFMASIGCDTAVMLDGGMSSQGIFGPEGKKIGSTRVVPHVILIYLKKEKDTEPDEPPKNETRKMLDLTYYVEDIISIAKCNNVAWDVGIDMFTANIVNSQNPKAPYYKGASRVDYAELWKTWGSMTLYERFRAYNDFFKWYRKGLREEGLL